MFLRFLAAVAELPHPYQSFFVFSSDVLCSCERRLFSSQAHTAEACTCSVSVCTFCFCARRKNRSHVYRYVPHAGLLSLTSCPCSLLTGQQAEPYSTPSALNTAFSAV